MGKLNRVLFTEEQMRKLQANPNVQNVSEKNITYSPAFKLAAVQAYTQGQVPSEIFIHKLVLTWMSSVTRSLNTN